MIFSAYSFASSTERVISPNLFLISSSIFLRLYPIAKLVIPIVSAARIPIVQPTGPVPKTSKEPAIPRAEPINVLSPFSKFNPL